MVKEKEKKLLKIQKEASSLMIANEANIASQLNLLHRSQIVEFEFLFSCSERVPNSHG